MYATLFTFPFVCLPLLQLLILFTGAFDYDSEDGPIEDADEIELPEEDDDDDVA